MRGSNRRQVMSAARGGAGRGGVTTITGRPSGRWGVMNGSCRHAAAASCWGNEAREQQYLNHITIPVLCFIITGRQEDVNNHAFEAGK